MWAANKSFNTQPPEGGWGTFNIDALVYGVSTHSRPKAAGRCKLIAVKRYDVFQHTAARRRLDRKVNTRVNKFLFQHTAARRRLAPKMPLKKETASFNTQPPEGGWGLSALFLDSFLCFNTQPPEGGWLQLLKRLPIL